MMNLQALRRMRGAALSLLLVLSLLLSSCIVIKNDVAASPTGSETTASRPTEERLPDVFFTSETTPSDTQSPIEPSDPASLPIYAGQPYAALNGNLPTFKAEEITTTAYETYHALDRLGRCTLAEACLGPELMPPGDRGSISSVLPTGWHGGVTYPGLNSDSLYNRCHLIAWSLSGENANRENLVTGTRYMNESGMLPFENMVLDYIRETGNHVMYRATPVFLGEELLCRGVILEAYSVEDRGDGISFHVFCFNVQPTVILDYATGDSRLDDAFTGELETAPANATYIINKKSKVFHALNSKYEGNLTSNMEYTTLSRSELVAMGYKSCGTCKP